jgi:hypothetical protein
MQGDPWQQFAEWLASNTGQAVIAGAAGGAVRWFTVKGGDWKEAVATIVVGSACAVYLSPIVQPMLQPTFGKISPGEDATSFAAFICGLGGISITGAILGAINRRKEERVKPDGEPKGDDDSKA